MEPLEHRLFSEISKNWAGCPLRSYETVLNYIRTTQTETGLRVTSHLVNQEYPKGVRISDAVMATLDIRPHETQPLRNYTIPSVVGPLRASGPHRCGGPTGVERST